MESIMIEKILNKFRKKDDEENEQMFDERSFECLSDENNLFNACFPPVDIDDEF